MCNDGTFRTWDISMLRPPDMLAHVKSVNDVGFSSDGRTVATVSEDETVAIWDVADPRRPKQTLPLGGKAWATAWDDSGRWLAVGCDEGRTLLWDLKTMQSNVHVQPLPEDERGPVRWLAFRPGGQHLAIGVSSWKHNLFVMECETGTTRELPGHEADVRAVAWDPTGQRLVCGSDDGRVTVWQADSLNTSPRRVNHRGTVFVTRFSPDGEVLLTAGDDKKAHLWTRDLKEIRSFPHAAPILDACFSADGSMLATASEDNTACIWQLATGASPQPIILHQDSYVELVAFTPDGSALVTAGYDVRVWDTRSGTQLLPSMDHGLSGVLRFAVSPDGRLLATAGRDGAGRLWPLRIGEWQTPKGLEGTIQQITGARLLKYGRVKMLKPKERPTR